ncbi:MAG: 50S ribosomal protein L17 [Acidobacteriia bacterium]|nr:50S ribosomal protein L17 [Terriglobia bacterium]
MRHRNAGWKLGRNTSHRRALLRNLTTSVLLNERVETTIQKAKAVRPWVERMITLGKRDTLHARRQAAAYLLQPSAVSKLFATIAPRFGDRNGGYTRIIRTGWRQGDGADTAILELLGSELSVKKAERAKADAERAKKKKKTEVPEEASPDEKK